MNYRLPNKDEQYRFPAYPPIHKNATWVWDASNAFRGVNVKGQSMKRS